MLRFLSPSKSSNASTVAPRLGLAIALSLAALGAGCGLTCELQGVPHDFADCESAEAALSGNELTGGEKADLEACIAESCEGAAAPEDEAAEE